LALPAEAAPTVHWDGSEGELALDGRFDLLEDPSRALRLEQLPSVEANWSIGVAKAPALGTSRSAWWMRARVENTSGRPEMAMLQLGYPQLDHVDFYLVRESGAVEAEHVGDLLPYAERSVHVPAFAFPLRLGAGERVTVLVRIETRGVVWLPLTLWSPAAFHAEHRNRSLLIGLFCGFVIALALYNFFLFLTLRDVSYLWYVLYVLCFSVACLVLLGEATQLLFGRWPVIDDAAHPISDGLAALFAMLFAASFLGTRERAPRIHLVLRVMAAAGALQVVLAFVNHSWACGFGMALLGVLPFICICAAIACLRRGFTPARYYLAGWTALLLAVAANSAASEGLIPSNDLTIYGFVWAGALEMVLLSMALASRITLLQQALVSQREQAFQLHKMEALGNLAGGVAHDLNNMLTAALGCASEIMMASRPGEEVHESAEIVEQAGLRAAQLTRQLLGFARRGKLQDAPVDTGRLVHEVATLLSRTIDKRIDVVERLAPSPLYARGDASQIQQMLLNLAVNARDAMPDGGRLTFSSREAFFDGRAARPSGLGPGRYVLLSVEDTGVGIADEIRARIFEPFFTTKPQGQGTGMGLAMVYGTVKHHGGAVEVVSRPGQGSRFEVYLPEAEPPVARPENEKALTRGHGRILVVDDEPLVREAMQKLLAASGYEVELAGNGREAVELFRARAGDFALVILDMVMPELDGQQCFEELKKIDPKARVLVCTGFGPDGSVQKLLDQGAVGFLQKPCSVEQIAEAVAAALRPSRTAA
jgi:signal transduction histidine kinase/ActR/RegA family two-component response regulator